jgi:phage baseplate assembly protein gpV
MARILEARIGGRPIPDRFSARLTSIEVVRAVFATGEVTMVFTVENDDPKAMGRTIDDLVTGLAELGPEVQIAAVDGRDRDVVFSGELDSLALELGRAGDRDASRIVITGHDPTRRLSRTTGRWRTFHDMRASDIIGSILGDAGVDHRLDTIGTYSVRPVVTQPGTTDWEFVCDLAQRHGLVVWTDRSALVAEEWGAGNHVELSWGSTLVEFSPELPLAGQTTRVSVHGWDSTQKQPIARTASVGRGPAIDINVTDTSVRSIADADARARVIAEDVARRTFRARGVIDPGDASIRPCTIVSVAGLGAELGGEHIVTKVTHHQRRDQGFTSTFEVGGGDAVGARSADVTPAPALAGRTASSAPFPGVVPAVVTASADVDGSPQARLRFSWLDSDPVDSGWARVAVPKAGRERGTYFTPTVDDEVLVAFEGGDFDRPVAIGSVWNAVDESPATTAVDPRDVTSITTTSGHVIRLVDGSPGHEEVMIASGAGPLTIAADGDIVLAGGDGKVIVNGRDLEVDVDGDLRLHATNDVDLEAGGELKLRAGVHASLEAAFSLQLDGGQKLEANAGMTNLRGASITTIEGALVRIN